MLFYNYFRGGGKFGDRERIVVLVGSVETQKEYILFEITHKYFL